MTKAAANTKPRKNMMAASEGRPFLVEEQQHYEDYQEATGSGCGCGCGCFRVFGLKWWKRNVDEQGTRLIEQKREGRGEKAPGVLMEKFKELKEASEVIAGPKWKTFIRKLSGYGKKQKNNFRFQYDEHSYALNFNSGAQSEDEDNMPPSFSARFTAPGRRQNELS